MTREEVQACLQQHQQDLRAFRVKSLELFGSVARNQAKRRSDVDFLVEFEGPAGLFHFFRFQDFLEGILGVKRVDLVERTAVPPHLRERIYGEAIRVG